MPLSTVSGHSQFSLSIFSCNFSLSYLAYLKAMKRVRVGETEDAYVMNQMRELMGSIGEVVDTPGYPHNFEVYSNRNVGAGVEIKPNYTVNIKITLTWEDALKLDREQEPRSGKITAVIPHGTTSFHCQLEQFRSVWQHSRPAGSRGTTRTRMSPKSSSAS